MAKVTNPKKNSPAKSVVSLNSWYQKLN